jgi:hypothetical protein
MSEVQRLGCIFTEPSATFKEIAVGRRSWWLPFVVMCLFSYLLFAAITVKVGWHQVAVNTLHADTATMERLEQAPPESRAQTIEQTTRTMEYSLMGGFAASPVVILIQLLLVAGVLMATINFIFAGKATFSDSLAVTAFSFLPSVIKSALGAAVAWFMVPESFNLQNFAPTSVGAFLSQTDTPAWLYKLASALDATTLWCMLLLGIGFATIGKVKRSGGYLAAFGWWGLLTLIGVVWAAARG